MSIYTTTEAVPTTELPTAGEPRHSRWKRLGALAGCVGFLGGCSTPEETPAIYDDSTVQADALAAAAGYWRDNVDNQSDAFGFQFTGEPRGGYFDSAGEIDLSAEYTTTVPKGGLAGIFASREVSVRDWANVFLIRDACLADTRYETAEDGGYVTQGPAEGQFTYAPPGAQELVFDFDGLRLNPDAETRQHLEAVHGCELDAVEVEVSARSSNDYVTDDTIIPTSYDQLQDEAAR